ncbi:MAG TPA: SgcJ/EcaC family oxidoreductase [Steroidobacteraceae bacterium]|nr:SgcJ/EcaC family oxidoreductase [Steroidobacteraceae bacterium]
MRQESVDETRIKEMHAAMIESWNEGSGAGYAAAFSSDADFIAFEGSQLKGRSQIAQFHQMLFETSLRNTRMDGGVHFVRFLRPDLAVLHAWATTTLSGQTNATASRDALQLFVATKHGGYWQFDVMQNSRRITMEQQRFADDFETLSPGDQGELRHRVTTMRH